MKSADLLIPIKYSRISDGYVHVDSHCCIHADVFGHNNDGHIYPLRDKIIHVSKRFNRKPADRSCNTIRFVMDGSIPCKDGYKISINKEILIVSKSAAGACYAVQTLIDMLTIAGPRLPSCVIEDYPDFKRRGLLVDCSRGKAPKIETLKQLVRQMAHWKLNELHLYIENVFQYKKHPKIGRGYSAFCPEDILAIQAECDRYFVDLVIAQASFGHFERILAIPEYRSLAELPDTYIWPPVTTLYPIDSRSIRLIADMYSEIMPLLKSPNFNCCCDEPFDLGLGRSKQVMKRMGKGQLYLNYVMKLLRLCEKYGKRMHIFGEVVLRENMLSRIPKNIVLLNWDYGGDITAAGNRIQKTSEFERAGNHFLVCPGTSSWQTHGTRLSNAMKNISLFAEQGRKHHADGILICDWGDFGHRNMLGVSLPAIAYGAAHAWNGAMTDDRNFLERYCGLFYGRHDTNIPLYVRMMGNATDRAKAKLYFALVESLRKDINVYDNMGVVPAKPYNPIYLNQIEKASLAGCRTVIDCMKNIKWPAPGRHLDDFVKRSYEEIQLAAKMDIAACERIILAKRMRDGGERVRRKEWVSHMDNLEEITCDFNRIWRMQNRPSRLRDNMWLLKRAMRDTSQTFCGYNGLAIA